MKTATATYYENMFVGARRHEFSLIITSNGDGTETPISDIRRWAVSSRGEGVDIAERAGIRVTKWDDAYV